MSALQYLDDIIEFQLSLYDWNCFFASNFLLKRFYYENYVMIAPFNTDRKKQSPDASASSSRLNIPNLKPIGMTVAGINQWKIITSRFKFRTLWLLLLSECCKSLSPLMRKPPAAKRSLVAKPLTLAHTWNTWAGIKLTAVLYWQAVRCYHGFQHN